MNKLKDTDLREALQRKYSDMPQLPFEFSERVMRRFDSARNGVERAHRVQKRWIGVRWMWSTTSAVAAAIIIAILFWPDNKKESLIPYPQQSIVAEQNMKETNETEIIKTGHESMQEQQIRVPTIKKTGNERRSRTNRHDAEPTEAKEYLQPVPSFQEAHLLVATEPVVWQIRAVQIAPDQMAYLVESSKTPPAENMMTASQMRARGQRLTASIQQKLQAKVQF